MTMPGDVTFNSGDSTLVEIRIVAAWYFLEQDVGYPETNFDTFDSSDSTHNLHVKMQVTHSAFVWEIVIKGVVLLKN